MNFQPEHFPVGTIATVLVSPISEGEYTVKVTGVSSNGTNSYLIHFNEVSGEGAEKVTERNRACFSDNHEMFVNLSHVIRIEKRGEGDVVFIGNNRDTKWAFNNVGQSKHRSQYISADLLSTVYEVAQKYVKEHMIVDYAKLVDMIVRGGFGMKKINLMEDNYTLSYYSVNKGKFNRVIKRLINKSLIKKADRMAYEKSLYDNEIDF